MYILFWDRLLQDDYFSKSRFASEVAEVALLSDRPVRSTRGQKVNYDDEIYKDNEFDEARTFDSFTINSF